MTGRVVEINIAAESGGPTSSFERIDVLPGQGVVGDRHFLAEAEKRGGNDLTLVDLAAVEAFVSETSIPLTAAETRRNVVTEGVDLNALVGKRFRVGEVECLGVELCEPCSYLEGHLGKPGLVRGLAHRAGLNADVLSAGSVALGDQLVVLDD
jgi:MOSC domain-containing protein YiiM